MSKPKRLTPVHHVDYMHRLHLSNVLICMFRDLYRLAQPDIHRHVRMMIDHWSSLKRGRTPKTAVVVLSREQLDVLRSVPSYDSTDPYDPAICDTMELHGDALIANGFVHIIPKTQDIWEYVRTAKGDEVIENHFSGAN